MKYIFLTLSLLLNFMAFGQIQINRSHAPASGPAPQINIGSPATFTTNNGIKVFVVENHKVPKVTVSLVLKKKPIMEGNKVGYSEMAGSIMRRGTESKTKSELDKEIDFLGGHIGTGSSNTNASSLTKNFDKIFSIFSDIILHPAFRDSELAKVKTRTLSGLESAKDDPNAIMSNVVHVVNYGKRHPYGQIETPETVKNITSDDLKKYYNTYWKPNIAYMAFVGDITVTHAKELVKKYLDSWKEGAVPDPTYQLPPKPQHSIVYIAARPSAVQTNIKITDPVKLKPGASDNPAVSLMNQILGGGSSGWLFQDLREKYGFTYGAYSSVSPDPLVGSVSASAAVRTAVTDSSLTQFMYQLNRIRNQEVAPVELDSAKNIISGHFALSLERPSRIAQFALNIALYDMPKDYYKNYLKSIAAVTVGDVQKVAQKYITPKEANIVLVGNAKKFVDSIGKYGTLQYVDIYGNPVKAPTQKEIPEGVTPKSVIRKYINAIGGMEKLKEVKDLTFIESTHIKGRALKSIQKYMLPNHYLMEIKLPAQNMTVTKTTVNGNKVSMQNMGKSAPMNSAQKIILQNRSHPFAVTTFLDGNHQLKLTGIENINGKEAYAMDIKDSSTVKRTFYFDTETGFILRKENITTTPEGLHTQALDMGQYKMTDGIMFPSSMKTKLGKITLNMSIDEVKINSGLSAEDFE